MRETPEKRQRDGRSGQRKLEPWLMDSKDRETPVKIIFLTRDWSPLCLMNECMNVWILFHYF